VAPVEQQPQRLLALGELAAEQGCSFALDLGD
jgi:hypothetical protein